MGKIKVTAEGGAFIKLPAGYDIAKVEALVEAVAALFPRQEALITTKDA